MDDPGNYELILKTELPLTLRQKIGEVGIDLDLPAAVITTLDLQLPAWVKVVNATHNTLLGIAYRATRTGERRETEAENRRRGEAIGVRIPRTRAGSAPSSASN